MLEGLNTRTWLRQQLGVEFFRGKQQAIMELGVWAFYWQLGVGQATYVDLRSAHIHKRLRDPDDHSKFILNVVHCLPWISESGAKGINSMGSASLKLGF